MEGTDMAPGSRDRVARPVPEPGVWLTSADIRDLAAADARHLARHTRAAHRTWGVVVGLDVVWAGGRRVAVSPGVALTRSGELVVIGTETVLTAHQEASGPVSVVAYPECVGPRGRTVLRAAGDPGGPDDVPLAVFHPGDRVVEHGD
ncbi:MAG TPA: hypothetical protein VLH10_13035, partial [Yinghuangia sp.]|nr:hypothetical protein [Yinghuangia sp.]